MEEEGILKQGANVALGALETYGKGVDYLNDQVSLRTLQQSQNPALGLVNKFISKAEPEWLTNLFDYSYKDLRDDVSEGVGWTAKKVTGSETAGNVAELGTQILLPDAVDFAAAGLPIGAAGKLKFLNVFKRGSKTANKYVDATAIVSKVNPSKLNDLKAFSFATKVDNLTGGNVKSEVMQMLSKGGDDLDGIFTGRTNQLIKDYKKASGGFGIDKLEKSIKTSITKHQLPTNLKAYKKINVRKYNKYINDELKHWAEHGKGSGKYFNIEHSTNPNLNIGYRLDQKSNPSKILDSSGKIIDRSFSVTDLLNKKIQNLSQADRLILLQNTTLDKATISKVAKLTPGGKIMHHAAPVQSTSKIQEAFFKANPNLTMDDWIPIQRKVEKELNFAFGDSPLNARYPETIKQHEQYHGFLREAGLYSTQLNFPKGLSPNDAYLKLKELGTKVLEIDKKVGVTPKFTKKTIGKQFGKRSQ